MCEAAFLLHPTPVPLQLFNPLLLLFCGLQVSLLQQPARVIVQHTVGTPLSYLKLFNPH